MPDQPPGGQKLQAPRRGPKPAPWYSVAELAALTEFSQGIVQNLLDCPRRSFFPGARYDLREGKRVWSVPEKAVIAWMGRQVEQHFTREHAAELLDMSLDQVKRLIRDGLLRTTRLVGHIRIPASAFRALSSEAPPARPSTLLLMSRLAGATA